MHNAQKSFLKLIMIDTQFIYYEDEKKKKNPKQHLLTKFVHQQ